MNSSHVTLLSYSISQMLPITVSVPVVLSGQVMNLITLEPEALQLTWEDASVVSGPARTRMPTAKSVTNPRPRYLPIGQPPMMAQPLRAAPAYTVLPWSSRGAASVPMGPKELIAGAS